MARLTPPKFTKEQKAKMRDPKGVVALQAAKPLVRAMRRRRKEPSSS